MTQILILFKMHYQPAPVQGRTLGCNAGPALETLLGQRFAIAVMTSSFSTQVLSILGIHGFNPLPAGAAYIRVFIFY